MKLSKEQVFDYWKMPSVVNLPKNYLQGIEKSKYLFNNIDKCNNIIELGCNVGRNLDYIYRQGLRNLHGVEINTSAIELMRINYPKMYENSKIYIGSIEELIELFEDNQFELLYTTAVFEHLHQESEWVFKHVVRIAKKIVTIEDEHQESERHFPRNYKAIFEQHGMKQVYEKKSDGNHGFNKNFVLRKFIKWKS